ncbi:MAG: ABC transporter ATP-binding protein [Motilibacteraceae bacterium]
MQEGCQGGHVLEVDGLHKSFGEVRALSGLGFTVGPGQVYGFVGRNGAGKTTTMRIVLGVLAPDAGQVRWRGRPVDAEVRRRIGYMPEERGLYPKMQVREQLEYLARLHGVGARRARAAVTEWLEVLGVAERAGDRVEALSLGNQQRVQLAAALVHDPEVLVLDEPFSGLDPVGVDALSGALRRRVADGVPVVFSSHQLDLVERLCDAVGIVREGRMVASGTVAELRGSRRRRLRVVVEPRAAGRTGADDGGWVRSLRGVQVVPEEPVRATDTGRGLLLELAPDVDDQAVLAAAQAAGVVRAFAPVQLSLTDLFREAVAA